MDPGPLHAVLEELGLHLVSADRLRCNGFRSGPEPRRLRPSGGGSHAQRPRPHGVPHDRRALGDPRSAPRWVSQRTHRTKPTRTPEPHAAQRVWHATGAASDRTPTARGGRAAGKPCSGAPSADATAQFGTDCDVGTRPLNMVTHPVGIDCGGAAPPRRDERHHDVLTNTKTTSSTGPAQPMG